MRKITITGGGLAGLTLGIALRQRDIPVVVHEASTYPRHKVCGEFMAGNGRQILESLGLREVLQDSHNLRRVRWQIGEKAPVDTVLPAPAEGLSRFRLDAALANRFRDLGGILQERSRLPLGGDDGVVMAAGRRLDTGSGWIGLKCHARCLNLEADLELVLGRRAYAGCSPVEDGWFNLCGLFPISKRISGPRQTLFRQYCTEYGLDRIVSLLADAEVDPASCVGVSGLRFHGLETQADEFHIGDAAMMVAPFTGNGMSMAMETAILAVDPLERYFEGRLSWVAALDSFRQSMIPLHRRARRSHYLHPLISSSAGQNLLWLVASSRLLPFRTLFRLLH